jgi:hypothetical protein
MKMALVSFYQYVNERNLIYNFLIYQFTIF